MIDAPTTNITSNLYVATSESACGATTAKVVAAKATDGGLGSALPPILLGARFSPDGNRIAYVHNVNEATVLSTIGFDGANNRDLSSFVAEGDAGLNPDAAAPIISLGSANAFLGPILPRWKDATHVGWISFVGSSAATVSRSDWELWVVEDKPGATAELAMRCNDSGLTHFDFLPNGNIVASARHTVALDAGDQTPMDLLVYTANATTKNCEIVKNLTNNTVSTAVARDLALSPDKTTVAFFAGTGTGVPTGNSLNNVTTVYTVPVDGSRTAAAVPGAVGIADFGAGPRWAAGGTVITWGQNSMNPFGGGGGGSVPFTKIASIPADGGEIVTVSDSRFDYVPLPDGGRVIDYHLRYGMGQGCAMAPGVISNGVVLAFGVAGVVTVIARRRRSKR
jgi:hypothetical protein